MANKLQAFLLKAAIILILASVVGILFSMVLGGLGLNVLDPIINLVLTFVALTILVLFIWEQKTIKIDNMNWFGAMVLFIALGAIGSAIGLILPSVSAFLINVETITISGLAWTVVYIGLAEWLAAKVGIR